MFVFHIGLFLFEKRVSGHMLRNSKVGNANSLYLNKYCKLWCYRVDHNRYNLVFRSRQLLRETKNCFHLYLHKIKYTIPLRPLFSSSFSPFLSSSYVSIKVHCPRSLHSRTEWMNKWHFAEINLLSVVVILLKWKDCYVTVGYENSSGHQKCILQRNILRNSFLWITSFLIICDFCS